MRKASRPLLLVLALALCLSAAGVPGPETAGGRRTFVVLHFSDLHGQIEPVVEKDGRSSGGLARLATLTSRLREENRRRGVKTFLVFSGDFLTGTAFSTLFQGGPEMEAFNLMRVSAMAPGNHDWDLGPGILIARARGALFPTLAANLSAVRRRNVFWKPKTVWRVGEHRVGVVGLTAQDTPKITAPGATDGFRFSDPCTAFDGVAASRSARKWDFLLVLSHCGMAADRALAARFPQIGLILGGHDHRVMEKPLVENGVPILQSGDRGRDLTEVTVVLERGEPPEVASRLIPVGGDLPEEPSVKALLGPYLEREKKVMGTVVGRLPAPLEGDRELMRSREMPLGDLVADAMRQTTGADAALLNAGTIREGLPEGAVTGKDLFACIPFFSSLTTVKLTGQHIQSLLDRCAAMENSGRPQGGFLQVSGVTVLYEGGKAKDVTVAGERLDPARLYTVACTDFLLGGGDGHSEFLEGRDPRDWGVSFQDLLRKLLQDPGLAIPEAGSRIRTPGAGPEKGPGGRAPAGSPPRASSPFPAPRSRL